MRDGDLDPSSIGKNNFESIMDGTAQRPYIYRQLLPMLANWVDKATPQTAKEWLFTLHSGKPFGYDLLPVPLASNKVYFLRYWAMYAEVFLFAWLSVFAIYWLLRAANFALLVSVVVALAFILLMPYLAAYYYDYPELAFMALVAAMALRCDWWWIIPVAALATWNKESFLLFIPTLYPLFRQRSSRNTALAATAMLALTCSAVYCAIWIRYRQNPGVTLESHLSDWIHFAHNPANLIVGHERIYGVIHPAPFTILPLALIVVTVWRGWHRQPLRIQQHGRLAAAICIPLFLFFCYPGELRDLSLLYVTFILLLAVNVSEWADLESATIHTR